MKGTKFVLGVLALVIGVISSAPAQLLFTNLTLSSNSNLVSGVANNNLNAVVYDGASNFLAVGANQVFVCGDFNTNQTWFAGPNWTAGHVLSATNGLSLDAVTIGNNLFVATGDKNTIFSVTNVFAQIGGWSSNGTVFNNTVIAPGIAYNAGVFATVGEAPLISWTNAIQPKTASWPAGTLGGQDFIESFRGVTAYGTNNGFAACGFYSDLLTSTNGSYWVPVSGQSQEPPLYGIASDGPGQTLVSVGGSGSGLVLIFTNRAQTFPANGAYDTNFISLTSASQLNAVAYTGSGFIAVGNSGEVLTLTNFNGTWKTNGIYSPVGSGINLNGVAFATTGNMAGVGELVGASGTVILAGTPPPSPINGVGATNCASYPAAADNGALSAAVVTDANHPVGTVTVDWYLNTNLVASGVTSFNPTNNPNLVTSNAPVNYTFTAVERDLRTGFISVGIPVILQINPRPATILAPLNTTDCNVGDAFILTNILTGIGPWTVSWNDGTLQSVSQSGPGPVKVTRTVFPTNTLPNTAVASIYYVTNVTSADTCIGNLPGDLIGTNTIVINPRPTASLTSLSLTNCNDGSSVTLTNTLTGIGPWTITWNDGIIQTNATTTLERTVYPTNTLPNAASNNVYYVTSVSDSTCVSQPGDITGANLIVVNPLPVATLTISTNDFVVTTNGVGTGLLESVSNPSGSTYDLTVGFQYLQNGAPVGVSSQTLNVTNHLAFSGIGPWLVILSDGSKTFTNTYSSAVNYVWQETISTNTDTNFTFSVQSVQSTDTGCSEVPTSSYDVIVHDAPTALVYTTNTLCGSATNIVTISAALGGFGPWTNVVWSDHFTNRLVTSSPLNRAVSTLANSTLAQIVTNYSIVSLTDTYGATTTSSNDLTGSAVIIVDPYTSTPPVAQSSLISSCDTVPISLSVTVPGGFTANWFDASTNLLTNGVTAYSPPTPGAGIAVTNIYLVATVYNDTNLNDGCNSPFTAITNIFENCPFEINAISLTGTNVVISWSGNFIVQSTTNLVPPITWMNVYTGALGPNFLTNSAVQPPIDFFRLSTPTN